MRFEILKGGKQQINTIEELKERLESVIEELNATKVARCWVCDELVHNWGVLFPESGPDGLGLGSSEKDGKENTRLAFFPFCKEHDLEDKDINEKIQKKLKSLRVEWTN